MAELSAEGFGKWTKRHFQLFIKGLVEHGKNDLQGVKDMIGDREMDEVKEYAEVFWKRYKELPGAYRTK
jgi:SWI/SNF-related matrix-associated actin-dependent regulator of chromatin subfamily A member 5